MISNSGAYRVECRAPAWHMSLSYPVHAGHRPRRPLDMGKIIAYYYMITSPAPDPPMSTDRDQNEKRARLQEAGTLNRSPDKVRDPMFATGDFFDPEDLLQVRYEMVRLVRRREATLAEAAERFGVSRPTCFRMVKAFRGGGLAGLIPARRGPRRPHKITPEILEFVRICRARHGRIGARRLVPLIEAEFGVRVHPRGLEKALARGEKKTLEIGP